MLAITVCTSPLGWIGPKLRTAAAGVFLLRDRAWGGRTADLGPPGGNKQRTDGRHLHITPWEAERWEPSVKSEKQIDKALMHPQQGCFSGILRPDRPAIWGLIGVAQ